MSNTVTLTKNNNIATITLNRPDVYNAFNDPMSFAFIDALNDVTRDKTVRVVVLTGAGKAFCSGQDLKSVEGLTDFSFYDAVKTRYSPMIRTIRQMPKPVICRLNGIGAGAGCSLALACDFIVASEKASLAEVFVNVGLVLDSGSSYFLPRIVGSAKAFELATMGNKLSATEAQQLGLINRVVAVDQLDEAVNSVASYYAQAPTKAIALMKEMLNRSFHSDLETMLELEAQSQQIVGASHDYKEGVAAFKEKRKPQFTGN